MDAGTPRALPAPGATTGIRPCSWPRLRAPGRRRGAGERAGDRRPCPASTPSATCAAPRRCPHPRVQVVMAAAQGARAAVVIDQELLFTEAYGGPGEPADREADTSAPAAGSQPRHLPALRCPPRRSLASRPSQGSGSAATSVAAPYWPTAAGWRGIWMRSARQPLLAKTARCSACSASRRPQRQRSRCRGAAAHHWPAGRVDHR